MHVKSGEVNCYFIVAIINIKVTMQIIQMIIIRIGVCGEPKRSWKLCGNNMQWLDFHSSFQALIASKP